MPKLVSSKEAKLPFVVKYLDTRDKIVRVWEQLDDQLPDSEKPHYRQLMFEYLLEMFGSWTQNGDSLPTAEQLYYYARIREKVA